MRLFGYTDELQGTEVVIQDRKKKLLADCRQYLEHSGRLKAEHDANTKNLSLPLSSKKT